MPVVLVNGIFPAAGTKIFGHAGFGATLTETGKRMPHSSSCRTPAGAGHFITLPPRFATATGTQTVAATFIGDRIAPQNIAIQNGQIIVNYADRNPGDPMTAQPSVGVTKYFVVQGGALQTVALIAGAGEHCGGNMMNAPVCAMGYHCASAPGSASAVR